MENKSLYLLLLVLAGSFTTLKSFSLKSLFHHNSVEGVDIDLDKGHSTVTVVDPEGLMTAGAEAVADVTGEKGAATGKGLGEGSVTTEDGRNITAFAKTTEKNLKYKWLDLNYEHASGGYKIDKPDSSSEEEKESRTRLSLDLHIGGKTKTISTPTFHF